MEDQRTEVNSEGEFYRIRVSGIVDPYWSERLGGLMVSEDEENEDGEVRVSVLSGWLCDQASLNGVLNTLYNNRFRLLSVECISHKNWKPGLC